MTAAETAAHAVYDAFAAADTAALAALLADIEWHENLGMPYGGVWHGFAEVAGHVFGPIASDVPDFSAVPDEVQPLGESRAVAFGTYRGRDGSLAAPFCHVWTFASGKLVKFQQYADSHLYRQQTGLM